ncbi:hypothetical protein E4656_13640 [Natronospirillum operosum]|uniref:Transcriptional regulator n=1 Tax=Natronospirillum operosum TaxID=2759953 RepID=A0A4Z0WCI5_9GAMM|nr:hypothetical protein [Natronospirillum operosum]TGG92509.1 hypothetical protein E4656_13640 [Natronospirillum operosum]
MAEAVLQLLAKRKQASPFDVCEALDLAPRVAVDRLFTLERMGWVSYTVDDQLRIQFHVIETQGTCDCCGLYDHHRVAGLCVPCLDKSSGLDRTPAVPAVATTLKQPEVECHD